MQILSQCYNDFLIASYVYYYSYRVLFLYDKGDPKFYVRCLLFLIYLFEFSRLP